MGFRVRRSIRIAPGIRINVGKRGISSVSIGKLNISARGVYYNINFPGTGISYRAKIAGGGVPRKPKRRFDVTIKLLDDGTLLFEDAKGRPLPANLTRQVKRQQRALINTWLDEQCRTYNALFDSLLDVHLTTPAPEGQVIVNPKPQPPSLQEPGIVARIFKPWRRRIEARNRRAQEEYLEALAKWQEAEEALRSDTEVMSRVLKDALTSLEWPLETSVAFEIVDAGRKVLVEVDLPPIEQVPTREARVNRRNLSLRFKERSRRQVRLVYLTHIHAIGFRIIGEIFACLPSVAFVILSAYSQRVDARTGNTKRECLYSVRVPREDWKKINFDNLSGLDVVECFAQFELRRRITKTGVISAVEPFEG